MSNTHDFTLSYYGAAAVLLGVSCVYSSHRGADHDREVIMRETETTDIEALPRLLQEAKKEGKDKVFVELKGRISCPNPVEALEDQVELTAASYQMVTRRHWTESAGLQHECRITDIRTTEMSIVSPHVDAAELMLAAGANRTLVEEKIVDEQPTLLRKASSLLQRATSFWRQTSTTPNRAISLVSCTHVYIDEDSLTDVIAAGNHDVLFQPLGRPTMDDIERYKGTFSSLPHDAKQVHYSRQYYHLGVGRAVYGLGYVKYGSGRDSNRIEFFAEGSDNKKHPFVLSVKTEEELAGDISGRNLMKLWAGASLFLLGVSAVAIDITSKFTSYNPLQFLAGLSSTNTNPQ